MVENHSKKDSKVLLWFKKNLDVKVIVINGLIAALYAVLTMACGNLSFIGGAFQLRLSEFLNLLVFFNPTYTLGLTIGCLISNLMSLYGLPDIILGTLGTLVGCLLIVLVSKTFKNLLLSSFMPCITNALIVPIIVYLYTYQSGGVLNSSIYFISFGRTFLGEFIAIVCIGYPLFLTLSKKYKGFNKLINATQNLAYRF